MPKLEILAYGSLHSDLQDIRNRLQNFVPEVELSLTNLLHKLGISQNKVQMVMLNHRPVTLDATVRSGDRVALFPPEYPIFADWKDYRSRC